jgi:hypothetical protein
MFALTEHTIPRQWERFNRAIERAHRRGWHGRVIALLAAKQRAVRRYHGVGPWR